MPDSHQVLATAKSLIKQFTGQAQTLTVPRAFVRLTGDHVVALVLNQILFWSDKPRKSDSDDAWFYKEHADWKDELEISPDQLRRAVDKLAYLGVERKLKKVNGAPKMHFRIDLDAFTVALTRFLTDGISPLLRPAKQVSVNQESRLSDGSQTSTQEGVSDYEVSRLSTNPIMEKPDNRETQLSDYRVSSLSDNQVSSLTFLKEQMNTTDEYTDEEEARASVDSKPEPSRPPLPKPKRAAKPKVEAVMPDIPDWIPAESWASWEQHRKEINFPLTPESVKKQIDLLDQYRNKGQPPKMIIDHAIGRGWRGLFPLKEEDIGRHNEQPTANGRTVGPRTATVASRDYSVFARPGGSADDRKHP
jgi:hypothetical protein